MDKFYMGMDIGTNSVGIACTDGKYKLLRAKGKDLWAVRLFDESNTAVKRRGFRTARRRLERRKQRLGFLQALFAPFIDDSCFFIRLNNSQYYPEDKAEVLGRDKNNIFADGDYTDKNYHAQFPTIYHLRDKLQSGAVSDLRLYYLALHHIIKYRGHFLFDGGLDEIRNANRLFEELNSVCGERFSDEDTVPHFDLQKIADAKECLISSTPAKDKLLKLFQIFKGGSVTKEIIKGMCGLTFSPKALFGEQYKEEKSINFKSLTDEEFEAMRDVYGDNYALLEKIRAVYSYTVFEKLLSGHSNISQAMIKVYGQHKADLKQLKDFLRENSSPEEYQKFFKSSKEKANYVKYVGFTKKGGEKINVTPCTPQEFFDGLKTLLSGLDGVKDTVVLNDMLAKIDSGEFLPKILHSDNGLFPHQVNEAELKKIVKNMVAAHSETAEIEDKILLLFNYRIPYYVGPLTGKNSWAVRSDEKITPYNFNEAVDREKSSEKFMKRMTNKCTYLCGEDVLPKASYYYQKFDVLNQINKLRINDIPISVMLKKRIFNELFLKNKKVTDKAVINFLIREGFISEKDKSNIELSGKDGEIKASMSSYLQLKSILGDFVDKDYAEGGSVCESIILWHTLNTDKNLVKEIILKNYGNIPEIKKNIDRLKGLSFKNFGKLSKKFLTGLYVCNGGQFDRLSILDLLYETNENLNEILFNENYDFQEQIKEENGVPEEWDDCKAVQNLYVSPAVRRGILQALKMADEYIQVCKRTPDKIFIEVNRYDGQKGDSGRKVSRKKKLLKCCEHLHGYENVLNFLGSDKITDMKLRQERLYLYFRQLGRCMYTGEKINLDDINSGLYDVDHILPRSYMKDDSLDNKVLVLRSANAEKSDKYPIPKKFTSQQPFWKMLLDLKLISSVTYARLTRTEPLGQEDYDYFINRQKVITDQTVKAVASLLKEKYPDTKIVYSRAINVSDFRQKFNLFKCRETNDLHHAKDAYLNVAVGNVYDTCFSTPKDMFYEKDDGWRRYNLKTLFTRNVEGAWDENSLSVVKDVYKKTSMQVTRYPYCEKGEFYNQTVYAHDDKGITVPRKGKGVLSNAARYGGYKSQTTACFAVVQSEGKKGKLIKTIEAVPVLAHKKCKDSPDELKKYFEDKGLKNVMILVPEIKCKQLISYEGTPLYITGVSDNKIKCVNAVQLFTDNKTDEYVKALAKFSEFRKTEPDKSDEEAYVMKTNRLGEIKLKIDRERNEELYNLLLLKLGDKIYGGLGYFATFRQILSDGYCKFKVLSVAEQVKVLLQILKFFKCNAELSDLQLIGGKSTNGTLRFSKNITDKDFAIINKSPCGLTVKKKKV